MKSIKQEVCPYLYEVNSRWNQLVWNKTWGWWWVSWGNCKLSEIRRRVLKKIKELE